MEEEEENPPATDSQQQQQPAEETSIPHVEEVITKSPVFSKDGEDTDEGVVKVSTDIFQHRPVPFSLHENNTNVEVLSSIAVIEEKISSLQVDDEKVEKSSPATPAPLVEAEPSSPTKNIVLTFALNGEEASENPVSLFYKKSKQRYFKGGFLIL